MNQRFQHFRGGFYRLIAHAMVEHTQERVAVYQSEETGAIWVRPYKEFAGEAEPGVPRFKPVEDAPTDPVAMAMDGLDKAAASMDERELDGSIWHHMRDEAEFALRMVESVSKASVPKAAS